MFDSRIIILIWIIFTFLKGLVNKIILLYLFVLNFYKSLPVTNVLQIESSTIMSQLLNLIKQQKLRVLSDLEIGIAVDLLYKLDYFGQLAQNYGKFYLFFILNHNFIDIYNLRQGHPLIDTNHFYILIQGEMNKNGFQTGSEIIVQRDGEIVTLRDSVFLKISIERMKSWSKLKQLQKEIIKNRLSIDMSIHQNDQKQRLSTKLSTIQMFNKLSKYDFMQLIFGCQMRIIKKGKLTHQYQQSIQQLIFIIQGELKLSFPYTVQQSQSNSNNKIDGALKRFVDKQSGGKRNQIVTTYSSGQWIGVDEYLQRVVFKSAGMVMSVCAQLLFVPVQLFDKLFNSRWNHKLFRKIEYFKQIRNEMLEKSLKLQIQKQTEMLRWSQEKDSLLSQEYRNKMSKYQIGLQRGCQKGQNPEYDSRYQQIQSIKNRFHYLKQKKSFFKDNLFIFDSNQNNPNSSTSSQRFKEIPRVNLFPEEYSRQFVYPSQQREINQAQKIKNTNIMMYMSPKDHRKACTNKHHSHSLSSVSNNSLSSSFQVKMFQMAKNVTLNFALNSTFYRRQFNKGDELSNLNFKTIDSIEPSRRKLILKRKNQIQLEKLGKQNIHIYDNQLLLFPQLVNNNNNIVRDFQPMSRRKSTSMRLSQYRLDQQYNIESKKILLSKSKQSSQTITIRNSKCQLMELKTNNKTLFITPQKTKAYNTIDTSTLSTQKAFKRSFFPLSIQ